MMLRRLRGLRAQLLLWTTLPLTAMLIVLSLAGILRHRQAMTQLVQERDRSLALAEAGRLGREIDRRIGDLTRAAVNLASRGGTISEAESAVANLADNLKGSYTEGLALLDGTGAILAVSSVASWTDGLPARRLATQTLSVGQPQIAVDFRETGDPLLLVAVPVSATRILVGAFPAATLDWTNGLLAETETHAAVLVLDDGGRFVYHKNPPGLIIDTTTLAYLPPLPTEGVGTTRLRGPTGQAMLITHARIEPLDWTLLLLEDLNTVNALGISVVEVLPMILLFVAVIALLAVSFGVATIVRPLQELTLRASRVAWGDFDAIRAPIGGVQEIEDLRTTLDQMAARIHSYQMGMRDYLSAITRAQEEERARLAHELHDDTVQALIALGQRVQMIRKALKRNPARAEQRLNELNGLIEQQLVALRRLISDLRPIYLEDLGFVPALEMLAKQVSERHRLAVSLEVRGEVVRLATDLELAAFRIVQEALNNAANHAQAQNVSLVVSFAADSLTLSIRDDGRGFSPPEQPADLARQGHFGLMGMYERATLYGGRLTIVSAPGQGTTVSAWLPIR